MQAIILAALIDSWIAQLSQITQDLDDTLPLERKVEVSYQYIGGGRFGFNLDPSITPDTHPEKFKRHETPKRLTELDPLRELVTTISDFCQELRGSNATTDPLLNQNCGMTYMQLQEAIDSMKDSHRGA